jgi:hypothetical protein
MSANSIVSSTSAPLTPGSSSEIGHIFAVVPMFFKHRPQILGFFSQGE